MPELRLTKEDLVTVRHALRHEYERGEGGPVYLRDVRTVSQKIDTALGVRVVFRNGRVQMVDDLDDLDEESR